MLLLKKFKSLLSGSKQKDQTKAKPIKVKPITEKEWKGDKSSDNRDTPQSKDKNPTKSSYKSSDSSNEKKYGDKKYGDKKYTEQNSNKRTDTDSQRSRGGKSYSNSSTSDGYIKDDKYQDKKYSTKKYSNSPTTQSSDGYIKDDKYQDKRYSTKNYGSSSSNQSSDGYIKDDRYQDKKYSTKKYSSPSSNQSSDGYVKDDRYQDKKYSTKKYSNSSNPQKRSRGRSQSFQSDRNIRGVNIGYEEALSMDGWTISDFQIAEVEGKQRFHDFNIPDKIMRAIQSLKYEYCTPIQALIIPEAFLGKDLSGKAQTGTGKTAAFLVTIFRHLLEKSESAGRKKGTPRVLIMAPTRELVIQIEKDARDVGKYCGFNIQSVFGGINYEKQRKQIENRNIDILVATPGRLLDYKEQGVLDLSGLEILVIDEADRMLDMGFIPDMKEIIKSAPPKGVRQTLLFSATLSKDIIRLASQWTKNPLSFEVDSKEMTAEHIEQLAYIVENREKFPLMYNIINNLSLSRVIVFGNRRDEVAKLADMFAITGISCGILSGDISQAKRIRTLEDLRNGKIRILCATDVAARGLHVDDISHVFNFTLPDDPEDYVHRIGRTGRAGAKGVSILFATEEDSYYIPRIEKFTGHKLRYINPEESELLLPEDLKKLVPTYKSYSSRAHNRRSSGGDRSGSPRSNSSSRSSSNNRFSSSNRSITKTSSTRSTYKSRKPSNDNK